VTKDRLTAAADRAAAVPPDGVMGAVGDRAAFDRWAGDILHDIRRRWPGVEGRSVTLLLVTGDTPAGPPARGFTLSRAGGVMSPADDRADPAQYKNYRTEWSFRDYFTGAGNRYGEEGRPHPVVRNTHISQTYQSRRDKTWRVDVVTPVWSGDAAGEGRVVALVSVGLDVDRHLKHVIDMPPELLAEGQDIARALAAYVVNDHGCWVWHEVGMGRLEEDARAGARPRDPENITAVAGEVAGERGENPDRYIPWQSAGGMVDGADRYVDPIGLRLAGDGRELLAHTLTFHPYQHSRYEAVRGRTWGFVVQVPEETSLAPVERLRGQLVRAGSILVVTLAGLAIVLWVWLFRLLRGWEFAGHG
jgi:hypothetical protein